MEDSLGNRSFHPPEKFNDLRNKTLLQIKKDFALQGFEIELPEKELSYDRLINWMAGVLEVYDLPESNELERLLYQFDISESFVSEEVMRAPKQDRSALLADAIFKRCFTKVLYRQRYS